MEAGEIGADHVNATWVPGTFDKGDERPVGSRGYFLYRRKGDDDEDDWVRVEPVGTNFTATVGGLAPATDYEIVAVSVAEFRDGKSDEARSAPVYIRTAGDGGLWWGARIVMIWSRESAEDAAAASDREVLGDRPTMIVGKEKEEEKNAGSVPSSSWREWIDALLSEP